ncbi:hypothetical protein QBC36DRAFT_97224 [Triangularia setosa]|uniref:DUF8035 domain-containing protein n=1 Tax=Triangularia setosa TaxID=2587417 RepID=A0AAN6WG12_9PEZI|nr:hypothetical protein QBC36DRAFT_97224 [Podospora setosa]
MSSRSRVEFDEREFVREAPPRRAPVREYDDYREPARVPAFMLREERPTQAGQLVLRQREVETMERQRPRSPSPEVRLRERFVQRTRSVSPGPRRVEEDIRIRQVERTREPSRAPSERIRYVERPRSPSPSIHERIRITDRREERRSPSPAPPPPPPQPQVIKGPTIEREVITHYRDIDHGMVVARPPSPPPQRHEHRDTEIDIYTSRKGTTEVDIHKHSHSHSRGRSVERPSRPIVHAYEDDLVVSTDRKHLHVDIERRRSISRGRRAHSAAPPVIDYDDEAYEIKSRIDARGKMGEAWNGITKDWTIVDVPPGTERVRMDGAGGASAEVTWQKYSGVRRAKFIPDRDEKSVVSEASTTVSDVRDRNRDRDIERERRLSVQIIDKDRRDRDRDGDYEKITDRRLTISKSRTNSPAPPPPQQRRSETWTEITKDLVCREAIQEMGYEYEETEYFYYIIDFLAHEEVVRLVNLSDRIRQSRKDRAREIQYEREWRDEWDQRHHHHSHSHSSSRHRHDDERVVEREIIYDSHRHPRQYRY